MSEHIKDAFFQLAIAGTSREYGLNQEEFFRRMILAAFTISSTGVITISTAPVIAINADNLTSGTVPLARLVGITNTQIAAGAAIAQSKLSLSITNAEVNASAAISQSKLALDITNAEVNASAAIAWTKISKTGSSLADLTTRSAADLSSGTIGTARLGSGVADATSYLRGDSTWQVLSTPGGADLVFTGDYTIRRNTSDGSDSGVLSLTGGGATGTARGGELFVYGNENATPGSIIGRIGNIAASKFSINRADGTESFSLLGADGTWTFTSSGNDGAWTLNSSNASGGNLTIKNGGTVILKIGTAKSVDGSLLAADGIIKATALLYLEAGGASVGSLTVYNDTSGSAANMVVGSNGIIKRSTSSLRYKQNIEPLTHGLAEILQLKPISFEGAHDSKGSQGKWRHFGFTAEDMDKVMPNLVGYHQVDGKWLPDSIEYAYLTAPIVNAIQTLHARLEAVEKRVH